MAKIKKAQSGYSATAKKVDSLRAAGAKQLGTPAAGATLKRLKAAEAQEKKEDSMKMKPSKIKTKMKMGGAVKKAQFGTIEKKTSPGGMYKSRTMKDAAGNTVKETQRRTLKGFLSGAPRGAGKKASMKMGGKMSKGKKC